MKINITKQEYLLFKKIVTQYETVQQQGFQRRLDSVVQELGMLFAANTEIYFNPLLNTFRITRTFTENNNTTIYFLPTQPCEYRDCCIDTFTQKALDEIANHYGFHSLTSDLQLFDN